MPKSSTRTPSGRVRAGQAVGHLHAEGVVGQEDVADAGHQDAGRSSARLGAVSSSGSTSSGWK